MRLPLIVIFSGIFLLMIYVTVRASLTISIVEVWDAYAANPWAVATLYDAYSGFTIFWIWVAWREASWGMGLLWFVLIMGLGNIATSLYLVIQLLRLAPGQPASAILQRKAA